MHVSTYIYLDVDSPVQTSRHSEGLSSVGVFYVAKNEEVKEEPANHLHKLTISLPLLFINHVLIHCR